MAKKHGTEIIEAFREIAKHGQHAKINGQRVDLFSASAVVTVWEGFEKLAQSPDSEVSARAKRNMELLLNLPINRIVTVAFQLVK